MNTIKSLTNIYNCKFVMINFQIKFCIQRRCFKILIRLDLVESNDNTFSLIRIDFEYSQNIRFRNQIIREVLRIWWFSNIFFQHFRYRRLNEFVENAKTQVENHQKLHHDVTFCLRRSRVFRFHRFQRIFIATRNQWNQTYILKDVWVTIIHCSEISFFL